MNCKNGCPAKGGFSSGLCGTCERNGGKKPHRSAPVEPRRAPQQQPDNALEHLANPMHPLNPFNPGWNQ